MQKMCICIETDVITLNTSNGPTNFGATEIVHLSTSVNAVRAKDISPYLSDWFT